MKDHRTISEALLEHAGLLDPQVGVTFIGDDGSTQSFLSYRELADGAAVRAAALLERGFAPGDRLGLIIIEPKAFVLTFFGALHAGLVPVPLAPPQSLRQLGSYLERLRNVLSASGARAVVASGVVSGHLGILLGGHLDQLIDPAVLEGTSKRAPLAPRASHDPAFLQFTSGSTSHPKGVVVTHANLVANASVVSAALGLEPLRDRFCSWLPLFHDMGLIGFVIMPVLSGLNFSLMPTLLFLKRPVEWLRQMSRLEATVSFAPNTAYGLCAARISDTEQAELDLSRWRVAGCGAEPIHYPTLRAFSERFLPAGFRPEALLPTYGLAEHTLAAAFSRLDAPPKADWVDLTALSEEGRAIKVDQHAPGAASFVCCGSAFPGHALEIVDESGERCPERIVGEIVLSGSSVCSGYFDNAAQTEKVFRDGRLFTGDLGYLADGELYVCGRIKDVIIIAGRNYHPTDIEFGLYEIEGVRKGSVIAFGLQEVGSPDRLVLLVETKASGLAAEELLRAIRGAVVAQTGITPADIVLLPPGTLPKTSSGKLRRAAAKDRYLSGTLHPGTGLADLVQGAGLSLVSKWRLLRRGKAD